MQAIYLFFIRLEAPIAVRYVYIITPSKLSSNAFSVVLAVTSSRYKQNKSST